MQESRAARVVVGGHVIYSGLNNELGGEGGAGWSVREKRVVPEVMR